MKSRGSSRIYVIRKKYWLLTAIIIITSIVFLILLNLNTQLNDRRQSQQSSHIYQQLEEMAEKKNSMPEHNGKEREKVYLYGENLDVLSQVLSTQKYAPIEGTAIGELKDSAADSWIIIDGALLGNEGKLEELTKLAGEIPGHIIIYHLDQLDLQNKAVQELLGIKKAGNQKEYKGIRLLNGFWTDAVLEEKDYVYQAFDLELYSGRPVYVTGYAKDYEKEKVVPLVFRNIYEESAIYVVNGDLMDVIPNGIIRGIFSQKGEVYMYPIVDASFMAIAPLPLLSDENEHVLRQEYFRGVKQLTEDILMPDIRMLASDMGQKPTIYARDFIRDSNAPVHPERLPGFWKEADKWNGEFGICMNSGNQERWEEWSDKYLQNNRIYSVMTKDTEMVPGFMKGLTGFVDFDQDSVMPFSYAGENKIQLDVIFDVQKDSGRMKLNYWASLFGYGLSSIGMDLESVYYPEGISWNIASKNISKRLENTFIQVKLLEPATVGETLMRTAGYSLMEPQITYSDHEIRIDIDYFVDKARFMLKTEKEIAEVENGSFRKVGEGYYIVEVNQSVASVKLEPGWQDFDLN